MKFNATWMNWRKVVISDQDLSFYAKGLALYLNTFMNDSHDMAFPSLRRIESEMNVSRKTVIKYLAELSDAGYIRKGSILNPATTQLHNTYTALIPDSKNPVKGGGAGTPPIGKVVDLRTEGGGYQGTKVVEDVHPNKQVNKQKNKQVGKSSRFTPPTLSELTGYIKEAGLNFDAETFLDYNISRDWMIGKSRMKDWRAAARNWNRRQAEFSGVNKGNGKITLPKGDEQLAGFAKENALPSPNSGESYWQYRNRLNHYIEAGR